MRDPLKSFIHKNIGGFKEKPSEALWHKIDAALTHEKIIYKPQNKSAMLKYGFGASIIVAGTFILMNLQTEKTKFAQTQNELNGKTTNEIPASREVTVTATPVVPSKQIRQQKSVTDPILVFNEPRDTISKVPMTLDEPVILHGSHRTDDSLDITNWPSAGNQRKKYHLSGENTTGKTIGCIKAVKKKINGFITMMQSTIPDKYRGKRVRMTGYLRTENVAEWAGLWMRVGIKGGDGALAFDNMRHGKQDRSIKGTTQRTKYEVVLDVPTNAANIIYGVMLVGTGQIYFDSFILEPVDNSVPVTGGNPDELKFSKAEKDKSYNPNNFWRWYVTGHRISEDGTWNINMEPNDF